MGGLESFYDGEAEFVDGESQTVDLVRVVVVGDNGSCTGGDTGSRVHKCLRDTHGECGRVSATFAATHGGERLDHTHNRTEQTHKCTERYDGTDDGEVFLHHGHFESSSLFDGLLDGEHLLFRLEVGGLLLLVFGEGCEHYVGNGALLLVAELFGLVHITLLKGRFHSGSKFAEVTFTVSRADGEPTLDSECNNGDEERPDDGHDETTLVDRTDDTSRFIALVLEEVEGKARGILRAVEVSEVTGTMMKQTMITAKPDLMPVKPFLGAAPVAAVAFVVAI